MMTIVEVNANDSKSDSGDEFIHNNGVHNSAQVTGACGHACSQLCDCYTR